MKKHIPQALYLITLLMACLIVWYEPFFVIKARAFLFLGGALILFKGGRFSATFYWLFAMLFIFFDCHIIFHYRIFFKQHGENIIFTTVAAFRGAHNEIFDYFKMFHILEYVVLCGILILTLLFLFSLQKRKNYLFSTFPFIFLFIYAYFIYEKPILRYFEIEKQSFEIIDTVNKHHFNATDSSHLDKKLAILIIGEGERQNYFPYIINEVYTPSLHQAQINNNLISFSDMISNFMYTSKALLHCMTRIDFENMDFRFHEKSLIEAYNESNYQTYYITHHEPHVFGVTLGLVMGDAKTFINYPKLNRGPEKNYNQGMLPFIKNIVENNSGKTLIVLKSITAHMPFNIRTPEAYQVFKPTTNDESTISNLEMIKNNYRNAMIYSGLFLESISNIITPLNYPSHIAFIGDHGYTLFDNGIHAYGGNAKGSYHIPFFIYGNSSFWETHQKHKENLLKNRDLKLTNAFYFETALSLSDITYPDSRPHLDLTTNKAKAVDSRRVEYNNELYFYDTLSPEISDSPILKIPPLNQK